MSATTICPTGSYCVTGVSQPTFCNPGLYGLTTGLSAPSCTGHCDRGYFCPLGSNFSTQVACNASTYNNQTGKSAYSDCLYCEPGYYCPVSAVTDYSVYPCAQSYYCPLSSLIANTSACEPGFYCPTAVGNQIPWYTN